MSIIAVLCLAVLCCARSGRVGWKVAETQLHKGYKTVTIIVTKL